MLFKIQYCPERNILEYAERRLVHSILMFFIIFKSGMSEWNVSNTEVKTIKAHFEGRFTQGAYITVVQVCFTQ